MPFKKMVFCEKGQHPVLLASRAPKPEHYECGPCAAGVEFIHKVPTGGMKTQRGPGK
jgi:hypothetical protein